MKNSQKGFASIVLIVVIVAILAVGGYFVFSKKSQQPKNEPISTTTNLQTYKNDKYGFELNYPNGYSATENKTGVSITSSQSCQKILGTGGGQWPKDCFIYDLLIQKNKIEGGSSHVPSNKIAGYSSEKFELDGGMYDNLNQIYIQFEKGGNWYISYVSYHSENKVAAENLLNQILSTFKFTGQAITQTSNQKLTLDILKNAEYNSQDTGTGIKLVKGTYPLKPLAGESQSDYFVKLDTDHVVFGDLNNDGQEDAVVILVSRSGGTGTFRQLAVMLNSNGNPSNVANQYLGDRTAINALTVSSGVISVDMTPWDGGTGTRKTVNYKLSGNELVEF